MYSTAFLVCQDIIVEYTQVHADICFLVFCSMRGWQLQPTAYVHNKYIC